MKNRVLVLLFLSVNLLALSQIQIGQLKSIRSEHLSDLKHIHGKSFRNVSFLGLAQSQYSDLGNLLQTEESFTIQVSSTKSITAIKSDNIASTQNGIYWRGDLTEGDGYLDLYFRNGMLSGTVYMSQKVYKLDALTGSTIRVVELNPEEDTHFECEVLEEHSHDEIEITPPTLEVAPSSSQERIAATPVIVDVMIIYPQSVQNVMGSSAAMENEINYRIEEANQVFANSLVNVQFRLVHHQVETSVSANAQGAGDVRTSAVESLRAQYKADLVSFWSDNGSAGSGFNFEGTGSLSSGYNTSKFSLVQTYYTFIHEMGHNMGAKHDRQTYYESSPTSSKLSVTPYYRYGKSFVGYRSIMSYSSCNDLPGGSSNDCERVPYLTNPDVMVNGKPFGVDGNYQTYDVNGPANNARRINETAPYVANYYIGQSAETYQLTVNEGTGSGKYLENATTTIKAINKNNEQLMFDQWTGDIQYLNNPLKSSTTVSIPAKNITVTATYKAIDYTQTIYISIPVISGDDDVEESGDGTGNMYTTSSDLEMTEDGSKGKQTIGIRFQNIPIPQNMKIESASILFVADASKTTTTSLTIQADSDINSKSFGTTAFEVSKRTPTNNSVPWNPTSWTDAGQYTSPDLSLLIQELVDNNNWTAGNAISFIITGTGVRSAHSYDGDVNLAPTLNISFKEKDPILNSISIEENKSLNIYPNPTTDFVIIQSDDDVTPYQLLDGQGNIVISKFTNTTLDLSTFSEGIYILKQGSNTAKVVKK